MIRGWRRASRNVQSSQPCGAFVQRAANPWDRFYRHHEAPWRGERPIATLVPLLGKGPVLELGCGNGKLLRPLQAAGIDAIGLDISFHALRRLDGAWPRVMADASRLPFADESFSAVLDIHCTGHLPAAGRAHAAAESWRVLRGGGHLVVERLTPSDLRAGQGQPVPGQPGMKAVQDGRATHFSSAAALRAEFERAGFVAISAATERREPGHRGRLVVRESVRVVFQRPA